MDYAGAVYAIAGSAIGLLGAIMTLRFLHFEKAIEELQTNASTKRNNVKEEITKEIRKGKTADADHVIELVTMKISPYDLILKSLEELANSMSAFHFDLISMGLAALAIVITVISAMLTDTIVYASYIGIALVVILDVYNFASNVQKLKLAKRSLKALGVQTNVRTK